MYTQNPSLTIPMLVRAGSTVATRPASLVRSRRPSQTCERFQSVNPSFIYSSKHFALPPIGSVVAVNLRKPPSSRPPIYVAGTNQHAGKTSVCLALTAGLASRFRDVGFMKPVGQRYVLSKTRSGKTVPIEKDAYLVAEYFDLFSRLNPEDISPVIISQGFTKSFLDGKITSEVNELEDRIHFAYERVAGKSDVVLCEGTGHCGVGSVVNVSNAKVAASMGADMVLVANGSLDTTIDDLELNRVLCEHHGVKVKGVIINRVHPENHFEMQDYYSEMFMKMWDIPLLGCIPDMPLLGRLMLADLEKMFDTQLISGQMHRFRDYISDNTDLVTTSYSQFVDDLQTNEQRTLYICHASRHDIMRHILTIHENNRVNNIMQPPIASEAALVVCDHLQDHLEDSLPSDIVERAIKCNVPILPVPKTAQKVAEIIGKYVPKTSIENKERISTLVNHYGQYIDFDGLLGVKNGTEKASELNYDRQYAF